MNKETRELLISKGRQDLVDIWDFQQEGYAGILPNGNIVDRRKHPKAVSVQKNILFGVPSPKELPKQKE